MMACKPPWYMHIPGFRLRFESMGMFFAFSICAGPMMYLDMIKEWFCFDLRFGDKWWFLLNWRNPGEPNAPSRVDWLVVTPWCNRRRKGKRSACTGELVS